MSALNCPRCGGPLESPGDFTACQQCPDCGGTLVDQSSLPRLLDAIVAGTSGELEWEEPASDATDRGINLCCPNCGAPMRYYNFLQQTEVQIDECLPCKLVWADALELQAIAVLRARANTAKTKLFLQRNNDCQRDEEDAQQMRQLIRRIIRSRLQ